DTQAGGTPALQDPTKFWMTDINGSVVGLCNAQGFPLEWQRYDAYGKTDVLSSNGAPEAQSGLGNRLGFQGRTGFPEFGLQYFRNRFYDPGLGRFLSRDPLGLAAGMNMYAAFGGDPINQIDPLGLYDLSDLYTDTIGTGVELAKETGRGISDAASAVVYGTHALVTSSAARQEAVRAFRDNNIRQAYEREQEHLVRVYELHEKSGQGIPGSVGLAVATEISDATGATKVVEGTVGYDTGDFAKTGNKTELSTVDRASRVLVGTGQVAGTAAMVGGLLDSAAGRVPTQAQAANLAKRADEIHDALNLPKPDPIAAQNRTTAVLETDKGTLVAGRRPLSPSQRAALRPDEVNASVPNLDAEQATVLNAGTANAQPKALGSSRTICPDCKNLIKSSGGVVTGPRTAVWPDKGVQAAPAARASGVIGDDKRDENPPSTAP
ncbi:MAG: RHS repeat-associated core domain-containing protein, partial [Planctomycetota bacterium]